MPKVADRTDTRVQLSAHKMQSLIDIKKTYFAHGADKVGDAPSSFISVAQDNSSSDAVRAKLDYQRSEVLVPAERSVALRRLCAQAADA